jgi:putative peptidoglycan lipid II flippase
MQTGFTKAIAAITAINGASALLSVLNISVIAYFHGLSRPLEVYFAAVQLFMLVNSLTQTGKIGDIFLPVYHNLKHSTGHAGAFAAFAVIMNWMFCCALVLCGVLFAVAPVLMQLLIPGFSAMDQELGVQMFRWLIPLLALQIFMTLAQTLANAEKKFGLPESLGIFSKLATLAVISVFSGSSGAWALVCGLWAGTLVQGCGFVLITRNLGYRHVWKLAQTGFNHWTLFRQLLVTLLYVLSTQIYLFILNAALSFLPQGGYGVFKYVEQLYAKTNSILLRPIGVVFFTHFSEAMARGLSGLRELAQKALSRAAAIIALALICIIAAGKYKSRISPSVVAILRPVCSSCSRNSSK